jgi:histone H3/H4
MLLILQVMNSFIYDLYGRLANESRNLVEHGKRKTLTALDIQSVRPSPAALPSSTTNPITP